MRLRRIAASALAAGAAIGAPACGGVLGPEVGPAIEAIAPMSCTIAAATADDQAYAAAVGAASSGEAFTGDARDDLTVAANRQRIFGGHLAALRRARDVLDGLATSGPTDRQLKAAAGRDVQAAIALMEYDLRYSPDDTRAPLPPEEFPTELDTAVESLSQDIREVFGECSLPDDVQRRQGAGG